MRLYTDGSCDPNPGDGGWAWALVDDYGNLVDRGFSKEKKTTNNRMELSAILYGLERCVHQGQIEIVSDSEYSIKVCQRIYKARKNLDIIHQINKVIEQYSEITWTWVRGHSGDYWNEYVDQLASGKNESNKRHPKD
jgi:ribonuclease HI